MRALGCPSMSGNSNWVSKKWLRWFTPNCISNPCWVSCCWVGKRPALLMRTSSWAYSARYASASPRTLSRSDKSTAKWRALGPNAARAASVFAEARLAITTSAPWAINALAVSNPMPPLPPVIRIFLLCIGWVIVIPENFGGFEKLRKLNMTRAFVKTARIDFNQAQLYVAGSKLFDKSHKETV